MKEEKGQWEDIIRSKIYDFEAETNPDDWDIISDKLSGGKTVMLNSYRRYGYIAAAAVAAMLIVGGLYFYPHEDKGSERIAVVEKVVDNMVERDVRPVEGSEKMVDKSIGTVENPNILVDKPVKNSVDNLSKTPLKEKHIPREVKIDMTEEPLVELRPLPLDGNDPEKTIPDLNVEEIEKDLLYGFNDIEVGMNPLEEQLTADASQEVKRRRWSFGMGGGGYAVNSSSGISGLQSYSTVVNDYEKILDQNMIHLRNSDQRSIFSDALNSNYASETEYASGEIKHKTPISAGLGVSYLLNDRWALQSGVVYTLLRSKGNYYNSTGDFVSWKQNLHYVGVPLSVSYKIAEWNRFQWYALAGGMCEFNVAGKLKKTTDVKDIKTKESETLRMKTPLWSVNARTGVAYPLWRFINVYAEAGVSYYFDNNSDIETIRSDKPFNVSLQAGIRLGF